MGLRDIEAALPPGFRFYPSDEELVCHYLYQKILHRHDHEATLTNNTTCTLVEIDLHTCEPWQLPEVAKLNSDEWYFFSFRGRKYATGYRISRATASGYWKATGKDRTVLNPKTRAIVGMRKTLVFYKSRAPNGVKTSWIMHEFRLQNSLLQPPKEDWVLCRVFQKSKNDSGELISPTDAYDSTASPTLDTSFPAAGSYHQLSPFLDSPSQTSPNSDTFSGFQNLSAHETNDPFFDMNFGVSNLREDGGVPAGLESMQFDGGMIFM